MIKIITPLVAIVLLTISCGKQKSELQEKRKEATGPPKIEKLGTIKPDFVEATPIVFKDQLLRMEWVRPMGSFSGNDTSYLHIVDHYTDEELTRFGKNHRFACAYVEEDTVYVVGTLENLGWHGTVLTMFKSGDLKNWEDYVIYDADSAVHQICNTSLCKSGDDYTLMFEISHVPEAGHPFTPRFLKSNDLKNFYLTPPEATYGKDRYAAPHCLRYHNGYYYSFHLEANQPTGYEQFVFRSKDLIDWEKSPDNPVLAASKGDKLLARNNLTEESIERINKATDSNNSDIDFCEYQGKLIITYSWGNQQGEEFLAEAVYNGTEGEFLEGWFVK